jgi:hypothetical protein
MQVWRRGPGNEKARAEDVFLLHLTTLGARLSIARHSIQPRHHQRLIVIYYSRAIALRTAASLFPSHYIRSSCASSLPIASRRTPSQSPPCLPPSTFHLMLIVRSLPQQQTQSFSSLLDPCIRRYADELGQ